MHQKFQKKGTIISVPDGEPVPKWFEPLDKIKSESDLPPGLIEKLATPDDGQASDAALSRMNKQELLDVAGQEGVEVPVGATNHEISRLIRADRKRRNSQGA
jgi:hypothetical protein